MGDPITLSRRNFVSHIISVTNDTKSNRTVTSIMLIFNIYILIIYKSITNWHSLGCGTYNVDLMERFWCKEAFTCQTLRCPRRPQRPRCRAAGRGGVGLAPSPLARPAGTENWREFKKIVFVQENYTDVAVIETWWIQIYCCSVWTIQTRSFRIS